MTKPKALLKVFIIFFFGIFGVHKFAERKIGLGILYFCTLGIFGIGWIYDLIVAIYKCAKTFSSLPYSSTLNNQDQSSDGTNLHKILAQTPKSVLIIWIIWTIYFIGNISSTLDQPTFLQAIVVYLFGVLVFCGIAWGISIAVHKKTRSTSPAPVHHQILDKLPDVEETFSEKSSVKDYDSMDGHTFEHFCADILSKNEYQNVEVTRGSGDQGIDILAEKEGIKYGIQCKCYASDIGNKAVQEAFAGKTYYNCHVAAVLTNRHFTKSAKELSESNKVLLWDREKLEEFIRNANHD